MDSTKVLAHAFTMGHINYYCDSLLYGLATTHINKLQCVHNAVARLICSTPCFNHVTPVLYSLHWLPVKFRIDFKILIRIIINFLRPYMVKHLTTSVILFMLRIFPHIFFALILNSCQYHQPPKQRRHLATGPSLLQHHHSGINFRLQ